MTATLAQRVRWRWRYQRRHLRDALRSIAIGPFNTRRSLWLCSWQRSGSTWLAEVLASAPGTRLLYEPANVAAQLVTGEAAARTPLPVAGDVATRDVVRALRGRLYGTWVGQLNGARIGRRLVAKDVRAVGLFAEVTRQVPKAAAVVLVRHPFAVARSVVDLGWYDDALSPQEAFVAEVANWCRVHTTLFESAARGLLVTYEDLRARPSETFGALTAALCAHHSTWRALRLDVDTWTKSSSTNFRHSVTDQEESFDDIPLVWREAALPFLETSPLRVLYGASPGVRDDVIDAARTLWPAGQLLRPAQGK